ncbi:matrilin-3-like [Montipora foliosa]|uniref:matrilin-3-like n=1 Tax=Montipora foliosa TaxID=591990 RepID=UPI0035F17897
MLEKDRKACQDVDECILGSHMCDHICHNTLGSFRCSCQSGYRLMADLTTCTDIDECTEPDHSCSQLCNNTEGSYNCFCLKGFFLQKDNKTCVDHNIILDSSKPTTLSAGLGAFVAMAGITVFIILGTVMCVILYKRKARVRSARLAEDGKKSLFSWTE